MDWQQLQSLYSQKESVQHTGTLAPEIITPAGKHPLRKKKTWLILLVVMIVAVAGLVYAWRKYSTRQTQHTASDPALMTPEQLDQAITDEVVADSKNNPISPEDLQAILTGKK